MAVLPGDVCNAHETQNKGSSVLAIGIHFLAGRYAACRYNDRNRVEWPPEFARFYSALVDAWGVGGEDEKEKAALEWLASLGAPALWASEAGERDVRSHFVPVNDPILAGSHKDQGKAYVAWLAFRLSRAVLAGNEDGFKGLVKDVLVDLSAISGSVGLQLVKLIHAIRTSDDRKTLVHLASRLEPKAEKELAKWMETFARKGTLPYGKSDRPFLIPESRPRQERTFPVALPHEPHVFFLWSRKWMSHATDLLAAMPEHHSALTALVQRVARLGHSSSLVTCWLAEQAPEPNWFPDSEGGHLLRTVESGQLARLCDVHKLHQAVEPRVLPARITRYRWREETIREEVPFSVHSGGWFVFEHVSGAQLPITRAADVAVALRGAILSHAPDPVPELLSGHQPDGRPSRRLHAAFVALPFVGRPHATGMLHGAAVVLPSGLPEDEAEPLLAAIGRWCRAHEGRTVLRIDSKSLWRVHYVAGLAERWTLREARWIGPATHWRSVTPVALGRNPGKLNSHDPEKAEAAWKRVEATLREDVRRIGLPEPLAVNATTQPLVEGSRAAGAFAPFPRKKGEGKFQRVLIHVELIFEQPVRGPLLLGAGRHLGLGLFIPRIVMEEPL